MRNTMIPDETQPGLVAFYHPCIPGIDLPQPRCCAQLHAFDYIHSRGIDLFDH